jgi:hypothetical protein
MNDPQLRQAAGRFVLVAEPDWPDVVRRSRRRPVRRRFVVAVVLAVTVVIGTPAFGIGSRLWDLVHGTPVDKSSLSTRDRYALSVVAQRARRASFEPGRLYELGAVTSVLRLTERRGWIFYKVELEDGRVCWAEGIAGATERFAGIGCEHPGPRSFPSPEEPVHDSSVLAMSPGGPEHVALLRGLATDPVASIAIESSSGSKLLVEPVVDNGYVRTEGLPVDGTWAMVALDKDGQVLHRTCLVRACFAIEGG